MYFNHSDYIKGYKWDGGKKFIIKIKKENLEIACQNRNDRDSALMYKIFEEKRNLNTLMIKSCEIKFDSKLYENKEISYIYFEYPLNKFSDMLNLDTINHFVENFNDFIDSFVLDNDFKKTFKLNYLNPDDYNNLFRTKYLELVSLEN